MRRGRFEFEWEGQAGQRDTGTGAGELRSEEQQRSNSLGDRELLNELFGQKPANGCDAERLQIQRRRQPVDSHDGRRHLLTARRAPSATAVTVIVLTASFVTLVIETGVLRIVIQWVQLIVEGKLSIICT